MKRLEGISGVTLAIIALVIAVAIGIAATAAFDGNDGDPVRTPASTVDRGPTVTGETDPDEPPAETDGARTETDETSTDSDG